jgi:hypothetical protein
MLMKHDITLQLGQPETDAAMEFGKCGGLYGANRKEVQTLSRTKFSLQQSAGGDYARLRLHLQGLPETLVPG